jgi:DNA-binding NarL/FixJ family response regulator
LRDQIVAIIDKTRAYEDLIREVEALVPATANDSGNATPKIALLTLREREILALIGRGYSTKQITHELGITQRTVETHRRNICSKLGLSGAALIHQATLLQQTPLTAPRR